MGALSLSLPAEVRSKRSRLFLFVSLMNIGRIVSYMAAGLVAGAFGLERSEERRVGRECSARWWHVESKEQQTHDRAVARLDK